MSKSYVAQRCSVTLPQYSDIEQHSDEVLTNVPLKVVRKICSVLSLDIPTLLSEFIFHAGVATVANSKDKGFSRVSLLKEYRRSRNVSVSDVAANIEFEVEAVEYGESSEEFLESLPISVLDEWAKYVGLPMEIMLKF